MLLMKPFPRALPALLAASALLLVPACNRPVEEEPVIQVEAAAAVTVNGDPIYVSEINRDVKPAAPGARGAEPPARQGRRSRAPA